MIKKLTEKQSNRTFIDNMKKWDERLKNLEKIEKFLVEHPEVKMESNLECERWIILSSETANVQKLVAEAGIEELRPDVRRSRAMNDVSKC